MDFLPVERHNYIMDLLKKEKKVRVTDLSLALQVSMLTIRRDFALLEERGLIERCHGGAILAQRRTTEVFYNQKAESGLEEKAKIALAAAVLIGDGETVFINSGSTTKEVMRALNGRDVRIITTNVDALSMITHEATEVVLIGGLYRAKSMSTVGDVSINQINQFYADKAILGCDAFSGKAGITAPVETESSQTRRMIKQTVGSIIIVADHSKIGVISTYKVAELNEISQLITDYASGDLLEPEIFKEAGVVLQLV